MAAPKQVEVTIFRGTYVTADGEIRQGNTVKVDADEAARLKALGVVKPDNYEAPAEVQDGTLKVSPADGPTVATIGSA